MTTLESYIRIKVIGKGSYGEVWLGRHKRDKKLYVLKRMDLQKASKRERGAAELEAKLLSKLRHPNIVSYKDSFETDNGFLYITMQYCEGGDLYTRLKKQRGELLEQRQIVEWFVQISMALQKQTGELLEQRQIVEWFVQISMALQKQTGELLEQRQIVEWFVQISMALQYMHERNILHRDLKTQNIFLTKSKIIKVGDLGIARVLDSNTDMATTLIGTPYYMSPELFSNKPYNHKSDVWALGCCVYEMTTLKHAFNAKDMNSLVYKILRGKMPAMPKLYDNELVSLIKSMLHQDPENRPSVNRILRHPFIKRNIQVFLEGTKARQRVSSASSVSSVTSNQSDVSNTSHDPEPTHQNVPSDRKSSISDLSPITEQVDVIHENNDRKSDIDSDRTLKNPSIDSINENEKNSTIVESSNVSENLPNQKSEVVLVHSEQSQQNIVETNYENERRIVEGKIDSVCRNVQNVEISEQNERNITYVRDVHKHITHSDSSIAAANNQNLNNSNSSKHPSENVSTSDNKSNIQHVDHQTAQSVNNNDRLSHDNLTSQSKVTVDSDHKGTQNDHKTTEKDQNTSTNTTNNNASKNVLEILPNIPFRSVASDSKTDANTAAHPTSNASKRNARRHRKKETETNSSTESVKSARQCKIKLVSRQRPLPPPPKLEETNGLPAKRDVILRQETQSNDHNRPVGADTDSKSSSSSKSSSTASSREQEESLCDDVPRSLPNMSARERRRQQIQSSISSSQESRPNSARLRLVRPKSANVGESAKTEIVKAPREPLKAHHRQPSLADDSSSSTEETEKPPTEQKKHVKREKREVNELLSVLDTTLNMNIDGTQSDEEKPGHVTPPTNQIAMPGEATLGSTDRLLGRIRLLRRDCKIGIGNERLNHAFDILDKFQEDEIEPKLVELLGRDNYDLYAGKIWQLKFCEDSAFPRFSKNETGGRSKRELVF